MSSESINPSSGNQTDGSAPQEKNILALSLVVIFGIFATTMAQPQTLGRLPFTFYMKEHLHMSPGDIGQFFFLCGLAWYFKPFAGILVDAFPLYGTRRRWYMMLGAGLSAVSWLALALVPKTHSNLLYMAIIINFFMVIASTATGAFLVEAGQRMGATGRLTSVRGMTQNTCSMIIGPLGGFFATAAFAWVCGASALFVFSLVPVVFFLLREKPQQIDSTERFQLAGTQLKTIFSSKTVWATIIFSGLFYFAPGFGTLLTFRQSDVLHFSKEFIGILGSVSGAMGIAGAAFYGTLVKKFPMRTMLFAFISISVLGNFLYMLYRTPVSAVLIDGQNGFFFTLAEMALLDLAARATPKGCEGLGYSLILSIRNLALFGADAVGSQLGDPKGMNLSFNTMIIVNSATTAVVLILLPFLPKVLMLSKDKQKA